MHKVQLGDLFWDGEGYQYNYFLLDDLSLDLTASKHYLCGYIEWPSHPNVYGWEEFQW